MKKRIINGLIILALITFASIGIVNLRTNHQQIQLDQVRLQDNAAKLKLLNEKYQNLNIQLDQTGADKAKLEQQLKDLEAEKARLEKQLSLKKLKTSAVAVAAAAPAPSGSHTDWMSAAGIPSDQWGCTEFIISHESGWRVNATNASSGAYGLPQSLPGSKMASAGADWQTNPITQLRWFYSYVNARYGSPCGAYNFWQSNRWY